MRYLFNVLRFAIIFIFISAGPAQRKVEIRGGGGLYNNDYGFGATGCASTEEYIPGPYNYGRVEDKGYMYYSYISVPIDEYFGLQVNFTNGYHISDYFYNSKFQIYDKYFENNEHRKSEGIFFIPGLTLSLDTLIIGLKIGGIGLLYQGDIGLFPVISIWAGHRLLYLTAGFNDFSVIPLLNHGSFGLGSDNDYFKMEIGMTFRPLYPSSKDPFSTDKWHEPEYITLYYASTILNLRENFGIGFNLAVDDLKRHRGSDRIFHGMLFVVLYKE